MSKQDLYRLVEKAQESILRDSELVRQEFNKMPHVFLVSSASVKKEILTQIARTKKPTKLQLEKIDLAVEEYVKELYNTFKFRQSKVYNYIITGAPPRFEVLVTTVEGNSDIFRKVQEIRSEKGRLNKLALKIEQIFNRDPSVNKENLKHLFDLGHMEGQSVSEKMIQQALYRFSALSSAETKSMRTDYPELTSVLKIAISSSEKVDLTKVFSVTITDESYSANRAKGSSTESKLLKEARTAINKFITTNVDWVNQKGSRSSKEIIISELLLVAKKHKAKTKGKIVRKTTSTKASITTKGKVKKAQVTAGVKLDKLKLVEEKRTPSQNWLSIVNIINAKLAERIKVNMVRPRLQNRTGRFAESAKVTGVEVTKEGFPTFIFSYQKNPYEVFDRVNGRSPWNTPNRDPKTLIALSIREIAQELAIGRFYTRRA